MALSATINVLCALMGETKNRLLPDAYCPSQVPTLSKPYLQTLDGFLGDSLY